MASTSRYEIRPNTASWKSAKGDDASRIDDVCPLFPRSPPTRRRIDEVVSSAVASTTVKVCALMLVSSRLTAVRPSR